MSDIDKLKILQAERLTKPMEARARILAAYDAAEGVAVKAALLLGISHRSLLRVVAEEGLQDAVTAIRTRARLRAQAKAKKARTAP